MADDVAFPWSMIDAWTTMTSGTPVYVSVRASQDRFYDSVKFFSTGTSMTSFFMSLYLPTSTTSITRVMDLGNVKSSLSATYTLQTIMLPDLCDVVVGETLMIGFLSVGGSPPNLYRTTLLQTVGLTTGQIPEYYQMTVLGSPGGQTGFSDTMTIIDNPAVLQSPRWAALSTSGELPTVPALYHDTLNRDNAPQLALPWASRTDTDNWGVYNMTASPAVGAVGAFAYWVMACRSDDHYAQVRLGADMASELGRDIDLYIGVRAQRGGGTGPAVKCHINPDGTMRIVTVTNSSSNAGLVQRALAATQTFNHSDTVKLVAAGAVYTAIHNDVPVAVWDDSGVLHPVGADYRRVNMSTSAIDVADLQIVDDFECGDHSASVQLVALTSIPSAEKFGGTSFLNNVTISPAAGSLTLTGYAPTIRTGVAAQPAAQPLTLTRFRPRVMTSGTITEIDVNHVDEPVPAGVSGCYVTLIGGGGGGGGSIGFDTTNWLYGGGGGGGGANLGRSWIPVEDLGATYSVGRGLGGAGGPQDGNGHNGQASVFTSGIISFSAGGGEGGGVGTQLMPSASLGDGGSISYSGRTPDGLMSAGGRGGRDSTGASSTYGGAGGGAGGKTGGGVSYIGRNGGSSRYGSGGLGDAGAGNAGGNSVVAGAGGGGAAGGGGHIGNGNFAGGTGGSRGGGGGGAGPCTGADNFGGGAGAGGYTRVEWVIETELGHPPVNRLTVPFTVPAEI